MDISTEFCPHCGKAGLQYPAGRKWVCPECGFTLYQNVAVGVGVIYYTEGNEVLFEVRGKEPKKGCITLPGGFADPDESAEEACVRECREEAGISVIEEQLTYVATAPNVYPYKDITYHTCDMFFSCPADTRQLTKLVAQEEEVTGFRLIPVLSPDDVDALPIAFDSARVALKKWAASHPLCW